MLTLTCNVGLADTLQSELMLYGVDVHIFFPGVMFTPGLEEENRMKPQIVKTIEGTNDGITAEQAALALLKGEYLDELKFCARLPTMYRRSKWRRSYYGGPGYQSIPGVDSWSSL
jgi:short-subunit dehydrogenase